MEDMAGKISELLSDPKGMEKIKSMASALFSDNGAEDTPQTSADRREEPQDNSGNSLLGGLSLPDGFDPMKLMNMFSLLKNNKRDDRSELLMALKPHLSAERQERVDKAVKLLKVISLLPVLKEQGIFDDFF